jgi:predicted MFS family arabinose efflux permease
MRLAFLGIAGLGLAFAAVAVAPTFPVALVLVVLAGALEGPVLASTLAVRATHSPADMQTQVVMTAASLKFGGFAAGSALAGLVVAGHGVRAGLLVLALLQGVALVAGLLARGTRRRPG